MSETSTQWRGKSFQDLVQDAKGRIQEISAEDVRQWLKANKDFVLLDVREATDYQTSHIEGAISLPRGILELEVDEVIPNQDKVIVTYCGGGSRSALAADTLQAMGYSQVYSLAKGFRGWQS